MIIKIFKKRKIRNSNFFVEPDEIFLDSKNIENFDTQQFEGRLEKPISKKITYILFIFFSFILIIFTCKLYYLQIYKGEAYLARSENNKFPRILIFADRGIIYDRNKEELAWNKKVDDVIKEDTENEISSKRMYISPGFSHVLGYVSSPAKDKSGKYWQDYFIGKEGLEKQYNEKIKGENGSKIIEVDAKGNIHSENIINPPIRGMDLNTSLDKNIQIALFDSIKEISQNFGFVGGAGIIMNLNNGEILASTSYPEYNAEILSEGKDKNTISNYLNDKRNVFLNKITSGLYTPGSIIKPFFAFGALSEEIIKPEKQIQSTGSISIPNPYDKTKPTIFKDWKAHGWTNMKEAIAVSSDVYFYTIGGGFEAQKGLGITNLEKYARAFNIGELTGIDLPNEKKGVIPNPEWKKANFKNDIWRIGDTYNTAIGQYGFQVTPLEMVRATATLANGGTVVTPHFILGDKEMETKISKINYNKEYFDIVKEGMRQAVTYGTAVALNVPYIDIAAKTGTAQVGISKSRVNSWIIGFFPYQNPKYAFTIMMESGPSSNGVGASSVMRKVLDKMYWKTPEYFNLSPWPEEKKEVVSVKITEEENITENNQNLEDVIINERGIADEAPAIPQNHELEIQN